jgi:hypothetical protein
LLKKIAYATVFCTLLLALHVGQAKAFDYPPIPLLKLMPEEIACHKYGESFNVSVWLMGEDHLGLDSLWDIAGFDLYIYFDPSYVNAVSASIDPDSWWSSFWPGGTFMVTNQIDNNVGTVHVAFLGLQSAQGYHEAVNGTGRILNIDFVVIAVNVTSQAGIEIAISNGATDLVGFPHPERPYPPWGFPGPPWGGEIPELIIPHAVENSTFYFSPSGDVNFDGTVNIQDVIIMASMYGSREGEPDWHVSADIAAPYGKVDILDLVTCTGHYGEKYP